jgi:hypothetical protein
MGRLDIGIPERYECMRRETGGRAVTALIKWPKIHLTRFRARDAGRQVATDKVLVLHEHEHELRDGPATGATHVTAMPWNEARSVLLPHPDAVHPQRGEQRAIGCTPAKIQVEDQVVG